MAAEQKEKGLTTKSKPLKVKSNIFLKRIVFNPMG